MSTTPETPALSDVSAFDPATCLRRGLCPVTAIRQQGSELLESHSLYYELHAPLGVKEEDAKYKVVFVMGLNSSSFAWAPQVEWFTGADPTRKALEGDEEAGPATILVFDNRGVGLSTYPRGPYSTAGMAEDAICLLDNIGWTKERELHVVGISLGGMIAQEIADRIPNRIASLTLAVTTPGGHIYQNFPPWAGLKSLARLTFITDPVQKVPLVLDTMYPVEWLEQKAEDDSKGRTNRQVQAEHYLRRVSLTKPQQFLGGISQMAAALTHNFTSPARLKKLASSIPKITIVTGDNDNLVAPRHSQELFNGMTGSSSGPTLKNELKDNVELVVYEATGHGINLQRKDRFNRLLERTWKEGSIAVEQERKKRTSTA